MDSIQQNQLTREIARDLVGQLAPQELPLFRAISAAFFQDPARVLNAKPGQGDMLGFGGNQTVQLNTPGVLGAVQAVVSLVGQQVSGRPEKPSPESWSGAMVAPSQAASQRARLRELLASRFNLSEIATICFDLGIESDRLPGSTLDDKSRELVLWCERRGRLRELVAICQAHNPNAPWGQVMSNASPSVQWTEAQLATVRRLALEKARQVGLTEEISLLLADALVGSLAFA